MLSDGVSFFAVVNLEFELAFLDISLGIEGLANLLYIFRSLCLLNWLLSTFTIENEVLDLAQE